MLVDRLIVIVNIGNIKIAVCESVDLRELSCNHNLCPQSLSILYFLNHFWTEKVKFFIRVTQVRPSYQSACGNKKLGFTIKWSVLTRVAPHAAGKKLVITVLRKSYVLCMDHTGYPDFQWKIRTTCIFEVLPPFQV